MSMKFYTVRFQVPLHWKVFLFVCIALTVLTFGFSTFRKSVYRVLPFKTAAVLLNSTRIYEKSTSVSDIFSNEAGDLFFLYKNKLVKQNSAGSEVILSTQEARRLNDGKFNSLRFASVIDGNITIGDWYGGIYVHSKGTWKRVYFIKEKKIYSKKLLKKDQFFYLFTSKGIHKLDSNFNLIEKELESELVENATHFNGSIFIRTRNGLFQLSSGKWKKVLEQYKEARVFGLGSNPDNLILFSREGLIYLDKDLKEIKKELPGNAFSDYTFNKGYEYISAYKKGFFVRKYNSEWIHFPSPTLEKARSSKNHFHNGLVWAAYYTKGFYGIDVMRLLDLEDAK